MFLLTIAQAGKHERRDYVGLTLPFKVSGGTDRELIHICRYKESDPSVVQGQ